MENIYERDDKDTKIIKEQGLTHEQALFVELYLTSCHLSGGLAYKEAYNKEEVTNPCYVGASRLLKKDKVKFYLAHLRKRQEYESDVTSDDLVRKWVEMMNTDITDVIEIVSCKKAVVDSEGKQEKDPNTGELLWEVYKDFHIKDLTKLTKNQRLTIQSLKMTREGLQFSMESKIKLAELIGKAMGMFIDRKEVDHKGSVNILTPDLNKWDDEK